jgi:hypothetical protein
MISSLDGLTTVLFRAAFLIAPPTARLVPEKVHVTPPLLFAPPTAISAGVQVRLEAGRLAGQRMLDIRSWTRNEWPDAHRLVGTKSQVARRVKVRLVRALRKKLELKTRTPRW